METKEKKIRKEYLEDELTFLRSAWRVSADKNVFDKIRDRMEEQKQKLRDLS